MRTLDVWLRRLGYGRAAAAVVCATSLFVYLYAAVSIPAGPANYVACLSEPLLQSCIPTVLDDLRPGVTRSLVVGSLTVWGFAIFLGRAPARRMGARPDSMPAEIVTLANAAGLRSTPKLLIAGDTKRRTLTTIGGGKESWIVGTEALSTHWKRSLPQVKSLQLSHEVGHIIGGDIVIYNLVRVLLTLGLSGTLVIVVALAVMDPSPGLLVILIKTIIVAFIALLALRRYLRFRESAADVLGSVHLGDADGMKELVANVAPDRLPILGRLVRSHPSSAQRLRALAEPTDLLLANRSDWLLLGCALGIAPAAVTATLAPLVDGSLRLYAYPISAVLLCAIVAGGVCFYAPLVALFDKSKPVRLGVRYLLVGVIVGVCANPLLAFWPLVPTMGQAVSVVIVILLAGVLCQLLSAGWVLAASFLSLGGIWRTVLLGAIKLLLFLVVLCVSTWLVWEAHLLLLGTDVEMFP